MATFTELLGGFSTLAQPFISAGVQSAAAQQDAASIIAGGDIAASGAMMTAEGLREAAKAQAGALAFNLEVDELNTQRRLAATSRRFQRTLSAQISQQSRSGLSVSSKSFLQLRNETSDVFGNALLGMKIDAENVRRAKVFENEVSQVNLENQARAQEYRAQAERVSAANRAAARSYQGDIAQFGAIQKTVNRLPTILGGLL